MFPWMQETMKSLSCLYPLVNVDILLPSQLGKKTIELILVLK